MNSFPVQRPYVPTPKLYRIPFGTSQSVLIITLGILQVSTWSGASRSKYPPPPPSIILKAALYIFFIIPESEQTWGWVCMLIQRTRKPQSKVNCFWSDLLLCNIEVWSQFGFEVRSETSFLKSWICQMCGVSSSYVEIWCTWKKCLLAYIASTSCRKDQQVSQKANVVASHR